MRLCTFFMTSLVYVWCSSKHLFERKNYNYTFGELSVISTISNVTIVSIKKFL